MSWAKLDDGFYDHPKVLGASLEAVGLFCRSLSYCSRHATDGHVTLAVCTWLANDSVTAQRLAEELVTLKLWERNGDGYVIHDFLVYNPSSKALERQRNLTKLRVRALRERNAVTEPLPSGTRNAHVPGRDGTGTGRVLNKSSKRKPGGFGLTPERYQAAIEGGLAPTAIEREWSKFSDHTFKTARKDWDATWRNWAREAADRQSRVQPVGNPKTAGNLAAVAAFVSSSREDV